ncbi:MAG: mechanosensitive ion channel domain-containing protein [Cyanobacteria bacterium J06555_13]
MSKVLTLKPTSKPLYRTLFYRCLALLVCLSVSINSSPAAIATETSVFSSKAYVVIDGRRIFPVEPSGPYSAQQRVMQANQQLVILANLGKTVEVEVVERNQQPTIIAKQQYLLTVTDLDTTLDKTPLEQAQEWANQLEIALQQAQLEREPESVKYAIWLAAFVLLLAAALHWGFGHFWRRPLRRTLRQVMPQIPKTGMPGAQDFQVFMEFKLALARLAVWAGAAWYITSLFPNLRQRRYDLFSNSTVGFQAPLFSLGEQSYTLVDLIILLGLVWGLFALIQLSARLLEKQVLRRTKLERGVKEVITQAYRYSAFAVGTLILLQAWGIDLRSVALLGSALGIGIGFGFQDIAKNFGSGLVLLFERSIQVGDFIEMDAHMGVVERIGARSITLRNLDNISVLVPNAHLIESQVMNWNHDHPISRLHLTVGVAYGSNTKVVKLALLKVAQEHREVLPKPAPDVYLKTFGDNAIEFDLMVWIRNPELQLEVRSALYFRIEEILREYGLSIPYPQRDLHLRTGTLPVEFSPEITEALIQNLQVQQANLHQNNGSGTNL